MKSGPIDDEYSGEASKQHVGEYSSYKGVNRGLSALDLVLRVAGFVGTLGSAIAMGTTDQRLPFFTPFVQFKAEYDDLPSLTFFVVANGIVSAYLLIVGLPFSVFHIITSGAATTSRVILIILDTVMLGLLTAGASAAASIVYLAHKGNTKTNWLAICQQFKPFCRRISGSLIGSFVAMILLVLLIILSAIAISRRRRG